MIAKALPVVNFENLNSNLELIKNYSQLREHEDYGWF